ncbi:SCO1664 family protein [Streptomyces sp. P38-E01]|uniref:SCO1664 family protein n=1 Tax=Streptomyces tardus TaxID=2780544 RepID=A0A949JH09_9ACTN|nr:SCO1664 family protein [Streptomyces tardus]MBU7599852.1 SCO1664 family protein [Streptomyces tardus]
MPASERLPQERGLTVRTLLAEGVLTVHGRIPNASNAVLYASVAQGGEQLDCVYKPVLGERPLWDFPEGDLAGREVAAYEVCRAMGWDLIPPTVLREGPHGRGMCQQWIGTRPGRAGPDERPGPGERAESEEPAEAGGPAGPDGADASDGFGGLSELLALVDAQEPGPGWKAIGFAAVPDESGAERTALLVHADDERLRRTAVLDAVINNADRKGGHLLPQPDGRLRVIDHGVTFHTDDKLRTLLWGWAGEPLPEEATAALRALSRALAEHGGPLAGQLDGLLSEAEVQALRKRVASLLSSGRHPLPSGDWPAIPWPPV